MAMYGNWQELREYRVWSAEDVWQCSTVSRNTRNGWYRVDTDGYDVPYSTRSEREAYECAQTRSETGECEARMSCPCKSYGDESCADAESNPYGNAHSVRTQVVDMIENRELDSYEL